MAKRIASSAASIAVAIAILLQPLSCLAYSAEELYVDCGLPYEEPYDEEDLDIIRNYNYAKRYASMFRYVAESTYDSTIIEQRIAECEEVLSEAEKALLAGFDKTEAELYQLESDYYIALKQLEEAKQTTLPVELNITQLTANDVPTYDEYIKALNRKRVTEHNCNLGEEKAPSISLNATLIKDYTSTSITYATIEGSGIVSLYNGKVAAVGETHVTINHYNGIVSSYKGVFPTVKVGDTVTQGSPIGLTDGEVTVKIKVAGELIDIYKLLEVSDEDVQD